MKKYLVDANLPAKISVWQSGEFEFVKNINDQWTDGEIWDYAKLNNLTIITKDAFTPHYCERASSENYSYQNRKYETQRF